MSKSKKTLISTILVAILVVAILGISYAYFTAGISGGESASTIQTTAGKMEIAFAGGNRIEVNNIYPRSTEWITKTFTLTGTNTTDLQMKYKLSLVVESNTFSSNALKIILSSNNTNSNGQVISNNITKFIPNGASTIELGNGYFELGEGKIHTYVLKLYFPDTGSNQNADQQKQFSSHIAIDAIQ